MGGVEDGVFSSDGGGIRACCRRGDGVGYSFVSIFSKTLKRREWDFASLTCFLFLSS